MTTDNDPATTEPPRDHQRARDARRGIYAIAGGVLLFVFAVLVRDEFHHAPAPDATPSASSGPVAFTPPPMSKIPDGPEGDAIRHGLAIFENTGTQASKFVGNGLACRNCHLDGGRKADSAPMWAAWTSYPEYRSKNKKINTMEDRLKGCFTYSMNAQASPSGGPPKAGDQVYIDLQAYFHWLATGAPTNTKLKGAGFVKLKETPLGYDRMRGQSVYQQHCAECHGTNGEGRTDLNGRVIFPPLWGPNSFNWGAGMGSVKNAAAFVKANMPLGSGNTLTDQQAWDVAAWIDSQERPKDPRQTGSIADAAKQFHSKKDFYGKVVDGHLLGIGTAPAGAAIAAR